MAEISVDVICDIRNKLLSEIKKNDESYRSAYVDGVLDVCNEITKNIENSIGDGELSRKRK